MAIIDLNKSYVAQTNPLAMLIMSDKSTTELYTCTSKLMVSLKKEYTCVGGVDQSHDEEKWQQPKKKDCPKKGSITGMI